MAVSCSAKESTVKQLPVATSIAGVSMRLKPGGLRELHWHAIAAEWAYVVKGTVRTTVISPNGEAAQDDFGPGDVWFFPKGHGHALQGDGKVAPINFRSESSSAPSGPGSARQIPGALRTFSPRQRRLIAGARVVLEPACEQ